ncbi:aldo/keto reductase [Halomonas sp. McH1-25]|uniref:aldo/keto reductase n=1 Tax=unclassified Halomonas TaxID=2609666 RepID=UPI001EF40EDE|nr:MULTISPECIES: aldo/keto reductase [unclassified Halomonas]MCG7598766.1 aldo/keto reductase [Halomonas sp. McH1-25]MCP1340729.1 aldo/keto reductase [Halomonas sp. FL8]MCP1359500.1 aldo/keto reductase [Halomonas sp. BBD45]MCP1365714.1 aldo/keto reductase [Halomonas sp. BBD48]
MTRSACFSRRRFLGGLVGTGAAAALGWSPLTLAQQSSRDDPLMKPIPATGERIPAIGMGTWITFNVGELEAMRAQRAGIVAELFAQGGRIIDSSPMYGTSEAVVGYCLEQLDEPDDLFAATKVWTRMADSGAAQMAESRRLWGVERFDLMQIHNLVDWQTHLPRLMDDKARGRIRYVGVTTSHGRRHDELMSIMRNEPIDFVQLTYNILDREPEDAILPLARERGIAVIANRPFRQKQLIERYRNEPLPEWAGEIDCANWPQFLLKFIVSHPDVTCTIPATTRVDHMREDTGAMYGRQPDQAMRERMVRYVEGL